MVDGRSPPETGTASAGSRAGVGIGEALQIVVIFAVIGPLVGTVVIAVLFALLNARRGGLYWPGGVFDSLGIIFVGPATGASYKAGGIPAAVAGLIVAIKDVYFGGASGRFALGTGVLVGLAFGVWVDVFVLPDDKGKFALMLIATATLSILACWRMVKAWFKVSA